MHLTGIIIVITWEIGLKRFVFVQYLRTRIKIADLFFATNNQFRAEKIQHENCTKLNQLGGLGGAKNKSEKPMRRYCCSYTRFARQLLTHACFIDSSFSSIPQLFTTLIN